MVHYQRSTSGSDSDKNKFISKGRHFKRSFDISLRSNERTTQCQELRWRWQYQLKSHKRPQAVPLNVCSQAPCDDTLVDVEGTVGSKACSVRIV